MTPQIETLGMVLMRHRLALGFNPEQVAKQIETSALRICRFENDQEVPTPDEWNRYRTRHERKLRTFGYLYEATRQAARANARQPTTPARHVTMGQLGRLQVPADVVEAFKSTKRVIEKVTPPAPEPAPVIEPTGTELDAVDLVEVPIEVTIQTFPAALKKARGARTMAKYASDAGIGSQSTVSGWESGKAFPLQAAMGKLVACSPELAPWQELARPPGNPAWAKGKPQPRASKRPPASAPADLVTALAIAVENTEQIAAMPKADKHRHNAYHTKHRGSDNHEDEDRPDSIETEAERIARDHTAATLRHMRAKRSLTAVQARADEINRELEAAKAEESSARKQLAHFTKQLAEVA